MRTASVSVFLTLLLFSTLFSARAQSAERDSRRESGPIEVTADKLTIGEGGTKVEATGSAEIKRDQTTLKGDEVRVNRQTQDVEAKGNVVVDDPEWKVRSADSIQMNLQNETGEIQNGDLFIEQGHLSISGRRFQKFLGQSYHVDEAFFTTCFCESGRSPWRISGDSIDLSPEGLGTIKGGYFYILDVPVLYLPYGVFPLNTERQTGFLFPSFGQSSKDGFRYRQPFFWAVSKSTDATVSFDFESRSRVGAIAEWRTLFERRSDLQLQGAYFNEGLRKFEEQAIVDRTIADQEIPQHRWSMMGTHRYLLPANWLTYSDFAAYSDDLFTRELIERFELSGTEESDIRRSRYGKSPFGVFRSWGDSHLRGEWDFYQDFIQQDAITPHRTPEIAFWGRRLSAHYPLELRWRAEGVNYLRRQGGDGVRLDLRPELLLPFKAAPYVFGSLSVAPRETLYHLYSPQRSSRNLSRELVEIRGNLGTTVSRIFSFGGPVLRAIRHVMEPEISYLFVPGRDQSEIPIIDDVDRVRRRNVLTAALTNRLWGKFGSPLAAPADERDIEAVDATIRGTDVRRLASLRLALSYDVDKERKGGDSLSDLDMTLQLTPASYLGLVFDLGVNPGRWDVTQTRASISISDPRPNLRPVLDPDFSRPNAVTFSYLFLRRGRNGFLAEDANINLDAAPNCPLHPLDPRCDGFNKNVVGQLGGNVFYHVTDHLLFFMNATYDVRDSRFPGYGGALKLLSQCECWTATVSLRRNINPAKTSFNFDFNLLGLGTQKSTLK
jgi:LPS-assembly protein